MGLWGWILTIFCVLYFSWCLQVIAKKLNVANDWMAWIPLVNIYYMVLVARQPAIWTLFMFIPFVNLYFMVKIWMEIAELRGRPRWAGYLMLVPVINYMTMTRIAFVDEPAANTAKQ